MDFNLSRLLLRGDVCVKPTSGLLFLIDLQEPVRVSSGHRQHSNINIISVDKDGEAATVRKIIFVDHSCWFIVRYHMSVVSFWPTTSAAAIAIHDDIFCSSVCYKRDYCFKSSSLQQARRPTAFCRFQIERQHLALGKDHVSDGFR